MRRHVTVSEMSLQQRVYSVVKNLQDEISGWKKLFNETMHELDMCAEEKAELEGECAHLRADNKNLSQVLELYRRKYGGLLWEPVAGGDDYETQIAKLEPKCAHLQEDDDDLCDIFPTEEELKQRREFLENLTEV